MRLESKELTMTAISNKARLGIAALAFASLAGCAQAGGLGEILGGVLGGQGNGSQVSGTIQRVDSRYQQIALNQSNGQQVAVTYDNNTKVVYQNQTYSVASLEYGDRVTARIQQTQNGGYYTDYVQVDQPVNGSTTTSNGNLQSLQGVVRGVDVQNGFFQLDLNGNTGVSVYMPYNPSSADLQRFRSLRVGDVVRLTGVYTNNSRVELRQFY
jgi:hypothetical protein